MPNGNNAKSLNENDHYKCLIAFKQTEVKSQKGIQNWGNIIKEVNTWAIPVMVPEYFIVFMQNIYIGQEATVWTDRQK